MGHYKVLTNLKLLKNMENNKLNFGEEAVKNNN
jgi:hypothetical protein